MTIDDYLNNKDNAMFFSKSETDKSYTSKAPLHIHPKYLFLKNFVKMFSYPTIEMNFQNLRS